MALVRFGATRSVLFEAILRPHLDLTCLRETRAFGSGCVLNLGRMIYRLLQMSKAQYVILMLYWDQDKWEENQEVIIYSI